MLATITRRVNSRLDASTSSNKLTALEVGDKINIVALKFGEEYRGNRTWFVDEKGIHITSLAASLNPDNNKLSNLIDFPSLWSLASKRTIKVGIYDSGVTKDISLFENRVEQINDHKPGAERHADYMATIIAGNDVKNGCFGLLPNAKIYSYQSPILASGKSIITLADFKIALRRFLDYNVDFVNVSMRSNEENDKFESDADLKQLLDEYENQGILILTCAGNEPHIKSDNFFCYPARLEKVYAVSGYNIINQPSIKFDAGCNLWTGVKLLAPSDAIFAQDFYNRLSIIDTIGTSVSCAVTTAVLSLLKIKSALSTNSPPLSTFLSKQIDLMPDLSISNESFKPLIQADSFKILDFSIIKQILSI